MAIKYAKLEGVFMKNTKKFFGIMFLAVLVVFSMTACSSDDDGGYNASEDWWSSVSSANFWEKESDPDKRIIFYTGYDGKTRNIYFFYHSAYPPNVETFEIDLIDYPTAYFGTESLFVADGQAGTKVSWSITYNSPDFDGWYIKK